MVSKGKGEDKLGAWDQQIHATIYKINEQVPTTVY